MERSRSRQRTGLQSGGSCQATSRAPQDDVPLSYDSEAEAAGFPMEGSFFGDAKWFSGGKT